MREARHGEPATPAAVVPAGTPTAPHLYRWNDDVQKMLESGACAFSRVAQPRLRQVAEENWKLCKAGQYSVGSEAFSLQTTRLVNESHQVPDAPGRTLRPASGETSVCVAQIDTAQCHRVLNQAGLNAALLNFANAYTPGGGYLHGASAQEEDLCRVMPTLYSSLVDLKKKRCYPIPPNVAHYTQAWLARSSGGGYELQPRLHASVITSAAPDLKKERNLSAGSPAWVATMQLRIRAILHAAVARKHTAVVLGAFGCGAFGNPADQVAHCFADVLLSDEFKGAFAHVVFAIVDPKARDGGNLQTFRKVLRERLDPE